MIEPIPAIDIIGGRVVRLTQGDYATKREYASDPVAVAREFEQMGFKRLHVVDLDGAKQRRVVNLDVLRSITQASNLAVDFGGGIKTDEELRAIFDAGARWATIGSIAVREPALMERWIGEVSAERLILGADVKDGEIRVSGWLEGSGLKLADFLDFYTNKGLRHVLCTDISRDGMLLGANVELYSALRRQFPECKLYASGGIGSLDDIEALNRAGVEYVVFGKAIYEGRIDPREVADKYLKNGAC